MRAGRAARVGRPPRVRRGASRCCRLSHSTSRACSRSFRRVKRDRIRNARSGSPGSPAVGWPAPSGLILSGQARVPGDDIDCWNLDTGRRSLRGRMRNIEAAKAVVLSAWARASRGQTVAWRPAFEAFAEEVHYCGPSPIHSGTTREELFGRVYLPLERAFPQACRQTYSLSGRRVRGKYMGRGVGRSCRRHALGLARHSRLGTAAPCALRRVLQDLLGACRIYSGGRRHGHISALPQPAAGPSSVVSWPVLRW